MARGRSGQGAKRVALLYHGQGYGGVEIHTMMMAQYMDRRRYHPVIVIPGYFGGIEDTRQFREEIQRREIPLLISPDTGRSGPGSYITTIAKLRNFWIDNAIDLIHIQTGVPASLQKDTLAAAFAGIPVLRTEHQPPSAYMRQADRFTTKFFDLFTSYIVVDSEASLEEEIQLVQRSRTKLYCSPTGIEVERFNPAHDVRAAKERIGLEPDVPVIGTVGRLHEQKGTTYLVEAMSKVISAHGPVHLLLVGDGPLRDELEALVDKLTIRPYVHFVGFQKEYLPFVQAMDIATMPSVWEGFSLSMLELMAMGKLMVVTDHASFRTAIDDGRSGYIVPVRNSEALAQALIKLLVSPGLVEQFRAAGIAKVRSSFSIQRLLSDMMGLYDRMLPVAPGAQTVRRPSE